MLRNAKLISMGYIWVKKGCKKTQERTTQNAKSWQLQSDTE